MDEGVEVLSGGLEIVGHIEAMWRKLTLHAADHSPHFSAQFAQRDFKDRCDELRRKASVGLVHIDVARDARSGLDLGYCISSVEPAGSGEIESLFVDEACRGRGIGDALIKRAVDWMEASGAKSIAVFTVYGSEGVLPFYARYGFLPKMVMLERKKEQG